jgi:pimeloyl-ACP methyl ester carboxylesterase
MTPDCWTGFVSHYQDRGYTVIARAWPHDDRPVAELRSAPAPELAHVGFGELADHYARIVADLPEPPILIGGSMGGLVVQLLLDRGLGSVGVAIEPAPPRGVLAGPRGTWAGLPAILGWGSWHEVRTMPFRRFAWSF